MSCPLEDCFPAFIVALGQHPYQGICHRQSPPTYYSEVMRNSLRDNRLTKEELEPQALVYTKLWLKTETELPLRASAFWTIRPVSSGEEKL